MKIVTWNINGIRAAKISLKEIFQSLEADIICLQETKVTRDMLDERTAIVEGYSSYFSFSNARTGYSGVATYVKDSATPFKAEQGLSGRLTTDVDSAIGFYGDHSDFTESELDALDKEGRTVITQHKIIDDCGKEQDLTIINVYCPRADPEREDRKTFKLRFYHLLQQRAEALLQGGSHVIVLGDVNTSHKRIDHCDPDEPAEFAKNPGRQWLNQFVWSPPETSSSTPAGGTAGGAVRMSPLELLRESLERDQSPGGLAGREEGGPGQFVDTYRLFHPSQTNVFTCWNTMVGARETNYGTRLDYILADRRLAARGVSDSEVLMEVMGSDHCPVRAQLRYPLRPAARCPPLCTKYFPEFAGVQTKLSAFFLPQARRRHLPADGGDGVSQEVEKCNTGDLSDSSSSQTNACSSSSNRIPHGEVNDKRNDDDDNSQGEGAENYVCMRNADSNTTRTQNRPLLRKSSSDPPPSKKQKVASGGVLSKKQSNLTNFFTSAAQAAKLKKRQEEEDRELCLRLAQDDLKALAMSKTSSNNSTTNNEALGGPQLKPLEIPQGQVQEASDQGRDTKGQAPTGQGQAKASQGQSKPAASAAWRNLLSGPPPAPLCRGHGEPCLLRTVKKEESLNKGRQFYVCPRPEGHKTNPEARCDHFEWVDKKRKAQK